MKTLFRGFCLASTVLVLACGGGQRPVVVAPDTGQGASTDTGEGGQPDLSPVPAPDDLVLIGRVKQPGALADLVQDWARLPFDWRKMFAAKEPDMSRLLHLDAPLEFAVVLDPAGRGDLPQPFAVVSVGLQSLAQALEFSRAQGESVRQLRAGVYRVGAGGVNCVVAASVGPAPARLVCGDRAEDIDALVPYATRGLPKEDLGGSDVRIELRAEPIRRRFSQQLRQARSLATPFALRSLSVDDPRVDRPLADTVHGLVDELLALVEDVDRLVIDAQAEKSKGFIDAEFALTFRGSSSWTVGTLVDAGSRAAPAPELFWQLPHDSTTASYSVPGDPKRSEGIRRTLAELADGFLAWGNAPKRARDDLVSVLNEAWSTDSSYVYARGEVADLPIPADAAGRKRELTRRGIGWHVMATNEPAKKYKGMLDKLVRTYNDPALRKTVTKTLDVKPAELPKLVSRVARGLPGGTTYELTVPGEMFKVWEDGKDKATVGKPLTVVLVLAGDANRSFLAVAPEEKTAIEKLSGVMKGGGKTLATREGLGALKQDRAVSQGFLSLLTFVGSAKSSLGERLGADATSKLDKLVGSMPHRGMTPMLTSLNVERGSTPKLTWRIRTPRGVIEDLGALGMGAGAMQVGSRL